MKCLLIFGSFLIFASICYAKTESRNAAVGSGCSYNGKVYPPGEHQLKGYCTRITCSSKGWISVHKCINNVETNKHPDCVPGDKVSFFLPFPDCCKRKYNCKHPDGTPYVIEDH